MKKTNKTFKRFAAITSASLLAACAMAPVFTSMTSYADDPVTYTITINNLGTNIENAEYTAYKVLGVEYLTDATGKTTGYKYVIDDKCISNAYGTWTSTDTSGNLTVNIADEAAAREFADYVYSTFIDIETPNLENVTKATSVPGEGVLTISPSEPGYYIVVGGADAVDGATDNKAVTSLVMLDTAAPKVTVNAKVDAPTLKKEIKHNELTGDAAWGVVGDNQIGDTVEYRITTTMPDPVYVKGFEDYTYIIHDKMTKGLDFNSESVGITIGGTALSKDYYTVKDACSHDFETKLKTGQTVNESFEIVFDMEKILGDDSLKTVAIKGAEIVTTYNCTLTAEALVASTANDDNNSNDNTAYLEFSNNPYASEGEDKTGETVEDTVYDWTFTYTVNKVNADKTQKLSGAVFNVKKGAELIKFTKLTGDGYTDKDYYVVDKNGSVEDITTTGKEFVLVGLDDEITYTLIEKAPPSGYNKCDDITFEISNTYDGNPVGNTIASISAENIQGEETLDAGNTIDVINKTGTVLPGTGGIGTTIFYLGGGAMAAIGGIYLISKRRMRKSEE